MGGQLSGEARRRFFADLAAEDDQQRRRILWALAGAILLHPALLILDLNGWRPAWRPEEVKAPRRLVRLKLDWSNATVAAADRPLSRPSEPVKIRLPLKSAFAPPSVPLPDVRSDDVKLPSLETTSPTSEFSLGPLLAPEGLGGMKGPSDNQRGDNPGWDAFGQIPWVGSEYGSPQIIFSPKPEWTEEARRSGIQGEVVLSAVFAVEGTVREIRLVRGLGYGLDEKAIQAAKRIKFIPARGPHGRPASVRAVIRVAFTLL